MFCPQCGTEVPSVQRPCPSCGSTTHIVDMKRPGVISVLAILDIVGGVLMLTAALALAFAAVEEPVALVYVFVAGGLGALALITGIGLWSMQPWGRTLQIVVSVIGLLGFPAGTILHGLILYYITRPGMTVLFSGKRPEELTAEEAQQVQKIGGGGAIIVIIACVGFFMICGIIAAIAVPNLLNAIDRGIQKRTMADCRSIAVAVEQYRSQTGAYPVAGSARELEALLEPDHIRVMPLTDGWSHDFLVQSAPEGYEIRSPGKDGIVDAGAPRGKTMEFNADIVWRNGEFVQWPEGFQR